MIKKLIVLITIVFVLISCKRDYGDPRQPPLPVAEEELITTFQLSVTDSATGATHTYFFRDDDGALNNGGAYYGPDKQTQTDSVIKLKPNSTYFCEVLLLNETLVPADTVSHEIKEKADEHQLFYAPGKNTEITNDPYTVLISGTGLKIQYLDRDTKNLPLGLLTKWTTADTVSFRGLNIILKHQPEEKNGSYDVGEAELQVNFSCEVR